MYDALEKSLENTQKSATNTDGLVHQICTLSCESTHIQTVQAILNDENTSVEDKVNLIHRENDNYDSHIENNTHRVMRLQNTQATNVENSTSGWGANLRWVLASAGVGVVLITLGTPSGRNVISNVVSNAKRLTA